MKEYVVNSQATRAVPLDGYDKGHYGLPLKSGYVVEAPSAKTALTYIEAFQRGDQGAMDMVNSGKINTF